MKTTQSKPIKTAAEDLRDIREGGTAFFIF